MSNTTPPEDAYPTIMREIVAWLIELSQDRLTQAKNDLASAEMVLGGLGYEEVSESLRMETVDLPAPQRSLARLASLFGEIERELEERRSRILHQQWESMAGEYALVTAQNLTEANHYLGLGQSAIAGLLVSLSSFKLNAWEKQTKLYGVRLYLERLETAITWAIESATNGLRQYHLDTPKRPAPPRSAAVPGGAPKPTAGSGDANAASPPSSRPQPSPASPQPEPPPTNGKQRAGLFQRFWRRKNGPH